MTETAADPATGGFGNLTNRNTFYTNIAAVKTALAGGTVTIEPFTPLPEWVTQQVETEVAHLATFLRVELWDLAP